MALLNVNEKQAWELLVSRKIEFAYEVCLHRLDGQDNERAESDGEFARLFSLADSNYIEIGQCILSVLESTLATLAVVL